ncbi:hypothetical protein RirG_005110 [Rhizophagus irregularis DAOM 197198w]|uniref:Uncharacterized protein n=1 Tax=Rhizophagus irregularis (strain DAOM 197198w) TaxID=1432141 RepID=A0A015M3A2_RHIIW|nr:hypothetical protein RirG_005110 [Rhizophagus irregularis DAOM 197198w]
MEVNKSFGKIDQSGIARRRSFLRGRNNKDHVIFKREENNKELNKECVRKENVWDHGSKSIVEEQASQSRKLWR